MIHAYEQLTGRPLIVYAVDMSHPEKTANRRFIIPSMAKSAATMLAMSGDELLLSTASKLGPIDPQLVIGGTTAPAQAILEQFQL